MRGLRRDCARRFWEIDGLEGEGVGLQSQNTSPKCTKSCGLSCLECVQGQEEVALSQVPCKTGE